MAKSVNARIDVNLWGAAGLSTRHNRASRFEVPVTRPPVRELEVLKAEPIVPGTPQVPQEVSAIPDSVLFPPTPSRLAYFTQQFQNFAARLRPPQA